MSDGPPYAENDPRHWTFRAGVSKPKPACPTCGRAMFFGLAGNWWCRPCKAGEPPLPKRPAPGETPRNAPEDRPMTDWPRGEQPGPAAASDRMKLEGEILSWLQEHMTPEQNDE